MRRTSPQRGFTLLEAVLALAILSMVLVVCLSVRAQGIAQRARLAEGLHEADQAQQVFDMLQAGLLPPPQIDPESRSRRWQGVHMGRVYSVTAVRELVPNPLSGQGAQPRPATVGVWRYEVTVGGQVRVFLGHR